VVIISVDSGRFTAWIGRISSWHSCKVRDYLLKLSSLEDFFSREVVAHIVEGNLAWVRPRLCSDRRRGLYMNVLFYSWSWIVPILRMIPCSFNRNHIPVPPGAID